MQIYETAGYSQRDAAKLILEHNLYGLDIDDRAFQLAYFALMMKARQYNRRILNKETVYHIHAICESNEVNRNHLKYFGADLSPIERNNALNQMQGLIDVLYEAKEYGSILNVDAYDWDLLRRFTASEETEEQMNFETWGIEKTQKLLKDMIEVGEALAQKYHVVVTNPPYMGSSGMGAKLSKYVKDNYPNSKSDMSTVFMERGIALCTINGYMSMINIPVWMFLSSYEKFREYLLTEDTLVNMVHPGRGIFGSDFGTTTFVFKKGYIERYKGNYRRLFEKQGEVKSVEERKQSFLGEKGVFTAAQCEFSKIPGSPVAYWVSEATQKAYTLGKPINNYAIVFEGLKTRDKDQFLRFWFEVVDSKWVHYAKGGSFRRWYGNGEYVVDWGTNGDKVRAFKKSSGANFKYYFLPTITYSALTSYKFSGRFIDNQLFGGGGGGITNAKHNKYILAFVNSIVFHHLSNAISQTLNFEVGQIGSQPLMIKEEDSVEQYVDENISLSRTDWDSFETSWDFARHPLVRPVPTITDAYTAWQCECNERFAKLKENEEELNRIFIEIYGLQDELTPDVAAKDVTVHYIVDEKEDAPVGMEKSNYLLTRQDIVKSLLSYAVGCMFGRYSLDIDGLAYAGGEWKSNNYSTFIPDADNIIPITDEEYFEDDIVGLFCGWLKKVYGADTLEENLDFIAKSLGNKGNTSREVVRNYFLTDFVKDHLKVYQKRPIYWLFDSGKQNGFKCLIYLHRYTPDTVGKVRADYLHRMQRTYEREIDRMQDAIDNNKNSREAGQAAKRKEKLQKQLKECRDYDEMLGHLALSRIVLDLDDGVKVNYRKLQTATDGKFYEVLTDSKNIIGKN